MGIEQGLKFDHEIGETISLFQKAPVVGEGAKNVQGPGETGGNSGTVAVIVVVLLVVGGGIATFFILRMRRQSAASSANMKIGPRGNKAITIASTDDMNSTTY